MADATCQTCPLWARLPGPDEANQQGYCHHALAVLTNTEDVMIRADGWCSEHPLLQRDRLAAMAMQGILSDGVTGFTHESLARSAYEIADAMLAERERKKK